MKKLTKAEFEAKLRKWGAYMRSKLSSDERLILYYKKWINQWARGVKIKETLKNEDIEKEND